VNACASCQGNLSDGSTADTADSDKARVDTRLRPWGTPEQPGVVGGTEPLSRTRNAAKKPSSMTVQSATSAAHSCTSWPRRSSERWASSRGWRILLRVCSANCHRGLLLPGVGCIGIQGARLAKPQVSGAVTTSGKRSQQCPQQDSNLRTRLRRPSPRPCVAWRRVFRRLRPSAQRSRSVGTRAAGCP
jgi:hypothetical protein